MANCINYKSKDFNDLFNQLGLPQGVLAAKIANWQEINGIDNWPTASDLGYNSKFNNNSLSDSNSNIKPGVTELFESNPELAKIGSQQLYSQYLDTIFPDSKVKDIVYHGNIKGLDYIKSLKEVSEENLETSGKNRGGSLSKTSKINDYVGAYFTISYNAAKEYSKSHPKQNRKVYAALINITNPGNTSGLGSIGLNIRKAFSKDIIDPRYITSDEYERLIKPKNIDGWIHANYDYTVFNKNNQLILGSKQDIEGFKEFAQRKQSFDKESPELNQILTKFLDNIGVKVEVLGEGDFVAKAKIVDKIIQVVQGKADITTLPEEAAHFFVEMLDKNGTIIKQLLTNIENDPLYSQTFEEYKTIYKLPDGSPDIEKIKKEAVGKKLAREIVSLFKSGAIQQQRVSEEINNRSIFMRAWNMITALIKKALNKTGITNFSSYLKNEDITTNVYENVARNILTNDLSGLDLNEPLSDYEMLQASNVTATEIKESLEKFQNRIETGSDKVGNETRHFYTIDKGTENERVIYGTPSLLASQMSRKKSKYRTVSDREKVLWEKIAARGTKVHSWVEECVRANINQYDATSSTLYSGLSDIEKKTFRGVKSQVDLLIKHINEQDPGSIFMTEVGVIDSRMQWLDDNNKSKYGIAGRIDLLVIHPDGTVSIYDWKTTSNKKDLYGIKAFKFFEYLKQVALYKRILMNGDIRYGIPKVKGIRKSRIVQIDTLSDNNDNITQANVVGQIPISGESTGDSIASKNLNHKLETMYEKLEKMIASKPPKDEIERKLFYERMNNLKDTIVDLQLKSNYKKVISNATNDLNYVNTLITQDDLNIDDLREAQEIIDLYTDILEYSDKNDMTPEIRQSFRMISERANELKSIISTKSQEILQLQADNYNIGNLEQTQREVGFLEKNFRSISQVNHPLIAYLHEITKRALYETELESNALRKEIFEHRDKLAKWASGKGMSIQEAYNLIVNKKTGNLISKYNKNYYDLIEKAISNNNAKILEDAFYIDMAAYNESLEKYKKSIANRVFTTNVAANKSIIDQSIKDYESANTNILTSKFRKVKPDKEDEFLSNEWKVLNSPNNKELKEFYDFFTSKTKELSAWLPNYGYKSNFIPAVRRTFIDEVMRLNNAAATSIYKKVVDKFNPSAVSVNLGSIHGNGEIGGEVPLYFVNGLSADEKSYDLSHVLQLFGEMSYNHKNMSQIETSALAGLNLIQNQKSYERSSTSPLGLVRSNTTANFKVSEEANKGWVEMYKDFMNYFVYDIKTKNPSSLTQFLDTLNQYTAFKYLGLSIFPALAATTANIANTQVQISKNVYFGNKEFSKAIWLLSGGRAMSSKDKDIAYALLEAIDPVIDIRTNAKDRKLKNNIVNRHATSEHFYAMLRKPDELNQKAVTLALLQKSTIDDKGNIVLMSKYLQDLKPFDYYSYPKGSKERNQMDAVIAEKSKNLKSVMDMASLDDKGNLLLDGKVLDKESILQFRQLSRQVNKNIIGNVDPNDIATYKVNAWARSLFLFRNWLPRAIDERYGEVRFNRELNSYEMGRYRTTFNHLFTFIKDEYNNSKWSLLVGVEEAAKAQYYKQLQLRPELEGNLSLNEFVDLYKQNLRASIKGLALTAGVLMLLIIAGKAYDDDDEVTPGEKFTLKVLNRSYTELMMFVNPIEALNILKSPSAATAPLSDLFKVFQHGSMEVFGAVTGDEDYQKRAKPLKYIMTFNPLYGPEKVYREFDESWKDMIEGNEND